MHPSNDHKGSGSNPFQHPSALGTPLKSRLVEQQQELQPGRPHTTDDPLSPPDVVQGIVLREGSHNTNNEARVPG